MAMLDFVTDKHHTTSKATAVYVWMEFSWLRILYTGMYF
jgi:hypothetical protein